MKILLAVDGSPISLNAAKFVAKLAKQLAEPPVVILFNADPPLMQAVAAKLGTKASTKYHADNGEYAIKKSRTVLKRAQVAFTEKLAVGDPAPSIIKAAKAERCDLVAMGSHGHGAVKNLFVGSVAAKVIAQGEVPVVVAR